MASKRKARNGKKLMTAMERIQIVLRAIEKAGGCVVTFFKKAAEALSATRFRHEREAEKFGRVAQEGLDKHRGYKIPRVVLDFAQQVLNPPESAESKAQGAAPKPLMRRPPVHVHAAPAYG